MQTPRAASAAHPTDTTYAPGAATPARRVAIEGVDPEVDGGRFAAKGIVRDTVRVEADLFADGHDVVQGRLLFRGPHMSDWAEAVMEPIVNDRFRGSFTPDRLGRWEYTLVAWVDVFRTWRRDLEKRETAGSVEPVDVAIGARIVEDALGRAAERPSGGPATEKEVGPAKAPTDDDARADRLLRQFADRLVDESRPLAARTLDALDPTLATLMDRFADRTGATRYRHVLPLQVDPERARASAWYELFPRSQSPDPRRAGTLRDVIDRLPYVASMGFDVLYLPPIHPIGRTARKGPNNVVRAGEDDPGSPWAIGGPEGGHTAIHPELGTLQDLDELIEACKEHNIDLALDLAFQASPDHPWVKEHPEWFRRRPDGTIQYAENPPKKYQDIYAFDFDTEAWRDLWQALADVVFFWADRGVRIFRVDNPHTKPFAFWEWLIAAVRDRHPETLFLSEAFTRPKVMYRLAKLGFTHSYTYFAWRNQKWELESYFRELNTSPVRNFFRPHLWPNTPDILTEYLQHGGRGAFMARLVLAATLGANYGIYGPPFELLEHAPRERGSEEYRDSEKYQVRHWNLDRGDSLRAFVSRVNRIRAENRALMYDDRLVFHRADNPDLIAYSKRDPSGQNTLLMVVDLDPHHRHGSWLDLDIDALGVRHDETYQVHDLLTDARYTWHGAGNYVELDPHVVPAHILRIRRRTRDERDFEYYL